MKNLFLIPCLLFCFNTLVAQKNPNESLISKSIGEACGCIDSINIYNKSKAEVSKEINGCIDKQVVVCQVADKLLDIEKIKNAPEDKDGNKEINLSIDVSMDPNSDAYKKYYYQIERRLMSDCRSLKQIVNTIEKLNNKSVSQNPKAMEMYSKGIEEMKKENFKKALDYYEKAVKIDAEFAFAWDNIGLCHRKLGNYDKALAAYNKSIEIDPNGLMPRLNIAVVYQYKKEYLKAIEAYEKVSEIEKNDPEIYYGIGQIYTTSLKDFEKGLNYMCKAYKLYVVQKSPYRTDAEKIINYIGSEMKKSGKLETFKAILKENGIETE